MGDHPQRSHVMGVPHVKGVSQILYVCECSCETGNHPLFGQFGLVYLIILDNLLGGRATLTFIITFLRKH